MAIEAEKRTAREIADEGFRDAVAEVVKIARREAEDTTNLDVLGATNLLAKIVGGFKEAPSPTAIVIQMRSFLAPPLERQELLAQPSVPALPEGVTTE